MAAFLVASPAAQCHSHARSPLFFRSAEMCRS